MRIAVYCASKDGTNPAFREAAAELGSWIGKNGHEMVYGGSKTGLMGIVSGAVLDAGGEVIGVIPRFLADRELANPRLTHLEYTETMAERKSRMLALADVCVALPGGIGTLEEIAEAISLLRLGRMDSPCLLLDLDGSWTPLRMLFDRMEESDFLAEEELGGVHFPKSVAELTQLLAGYAEKK